MDFLVGIVLAIIASWILAKACDGFEAAADYLGRNLGEGTKGATINAIGSSMPELLVTSIYLFAYMDTTGFAGGIGTTAGSAVFNAMVIPALVILFVLLKNRSTKIVLSKAVVLRDGLTLIFAEFFLIYFVGNKLEWFHGLALMSIYVFYAGWMVYRHKRAVALGLIVEKDDDDDDDDEEEEQTGSRLIAILKLDFEYAVVGNNESTGGNSMALLATATLFIAGASAILVHSCEIIGKTIGINGYFVAVILAAAASSIPDTILSVKDAKKGNYDDAVANALGSNIFDICFALGAPLFIFTLIYGPIIMSPETAGDIVELRILLLVLTIITFILFLAYKQMTKFLAIILLSMYVMFIVFVAARAYKVPFAMKIAKELRHIDKVVFNGNPIDISEVKKSEVKKN